MSKTKQKSFVEQVLAGEATIEDIHEFIDEWHDSPEETRSLPEFLGLSADEYGAWVENPAYLRTLARLRKQN